ncbi:protein HGH1 [Populus alba x Populus x berolinensis]|nr:protein HGH1 [Populus alba x Populus x berolinensis]
MATELEELVGFLSSPSPPVKKAAVEIVRDLTGSEDGLLSLSMYASTVLPSLSQLLKEKKEVSEPAAEALINLSLNSNLATKMVEMGMIKTAMDVLYKPDSSITRLLVMLLVNLTQLDSGIVSLLQIEDEKMQGLYVMKLVSGTLRNCCFEAENQLQNFLLISEFLWPALLLPVAGKKIYSEQDTSKMPLELGSALSIEREPWDDPEIRVEALESIYLIIVQEAGLRTFWSVNGPRILQLGYEDEEDPKVMEAYERVGSLLVHGSGTEEPSSETSK